jgi:hypothetical protein
MTLAFKLSTVGSGVGVGIRVSVGKGVKVSVKVEGGVRVAGGAVRVSAEGRLDGVERGSGGSDAGDTLFVVARLQAEVESSARRTRRFAVFMA